MLLLFLKVEVLQVVGPCKVIQIPETGENFAREIRNPRLSSP